MFVFQLSVVAELQARIAALEALVVFAEQDKARAVAESKLKNVQLETQLAQTQVTSYTHYAVLVVDFDCNSCVQVK